MENLHIKFQIYIFDCIRIINKHITLIYGASKRKLDHPNQFKINVEIHNNKLIIENRTLDYRIAYQIKLLYFRSSWKRLSWIFVIPLNEIISFININDIGFHLFQKRIDLNPNMHAQL